MRGVPSDPPYYPVMDRRRFLPSLAGTMIWPLVAGAQQRTRMSRVGYLSELTRSDPTYTDLRDAFLQGLRDHGQVEGQTLTIEWRFAEGNESRLGNLAAGLTRQGVDLLFAEGTPSALAAKRATGTIPIVFSPVADPIGSGLVTNLARPGANVTGVTFMAQLSGKRLELLKEAVPRMTRLGVLSHAGNPSEATRKGLLAETESAARTAGVSLQGVEAHGPQDLDRAFATLSGEKVGGLLLLPSLMFMSERRRIADLAARHRLPTMFFFREFAEAGGLASYGPRFPELWRRAASYVDKILKGARSQVSFRSSSRPSSSSSSTSRPPRPSASRSRRRCCCGRTRSSSDTTRGTGRPRPPPPGRARRGARARPCA
jgi:putative ABC transport system substrate-binding protein